jgi:DNA-directed RNA polymerase specialized sigma24 family protein
MLHPRFQGQEHPRIPGRFTEWWVPPAVDDPGYEEVDDDSELLALIDAAHLTKKERAAVELALRGLSTREIADVLDISTAAVSARLTKAQRALAATYRRVAQ